MAAITYFDANAVEPSAPRDIIPPEDRPLEPD